MGKHSSTPAPDLIITSIFLITLLFFNIPTYAQDGEALFKSICAVCHKTTNEKLIGPGLANINEKRSIEWFKKFVTSSQSMVNNGDPDAVKIFEEYNKIIMPDQAFSDEELIAIYEYIKSVSPSASDLAETTPRAEKAVPFEPSEDDIFIGQNLFSGKQRFEQGGPSCISCHTVRYDNIISGGGLAVDLSDAYERIGKDGINAMITGLPFPQMRISYQNHEITEQESLQLVSFLNEVTEKRQDQGIASYRNMLLLWGFGGAAVLMGIFPLFWYKRKKDSVNRRIYERQIKSDN